MTATVPGLEFASCAGTVSACSGCHVMALRVDDIQRGHALFGGSIGGQLNEAFLRQQKQSTRLVGVVGGDQDVASAAMSATEATPLPYRPNGS